MRTHSLLLGLILVLLLTVPGCAGLIERPKEQSFSGTLNIIGTAEEEYVRGMVRAFELDSGIRTIYERLSAGQALDALKAERNDPRHSVWWGGSIDGYIEANSSGLLDLYKPKSFSTIPRQYKDPDGAWTGVYVGALAIGVNTRVLSEKGLPEPTSWADLTKPIYKGLVSMAHPATSGTAYTALATVVQLNGKDIDKGLAYFRALSANIKEFEQSGSAPARLAGRGTVAIAIAFAHDIIAANDDGAKGLNVIFPSEGTGYEIGGMAMIKSAPYQEQARRYLDWALSPKAQELGPLFTAYQIPTNPDAKVPEKSVRLSAVKTIDYDFEWSGENRQKMVDMFERDDQPAAEVVIPGGWKCPRIRASGLNFYYEIHGEGAPLVLIEGIGYAVWMWFRQVGPCRPTTGSSCTTIAGWAAAIAHRRTTLSTTWRTTW